LSNLLSFHLFARSHVKHPLLLLIWQLFTGQAKLYLNTLLTYKTQPDYHCHIVACWLGQKLNLTWKW